MTRSLQVDIPPPSLRQARFNFVFLLSVLSAVFSFEASAQTARASQKHSTLGKYLQTVHGAIDAVPFTKDDLDSRESGTTQSANSLIIPRSLNSAADIVDWDSTFTYPRLAGTVNAVAVRGTDVYAGGSISTAGSVILNNIGRWDGTNWNSLGGGMDAAVLAIAVDGSDIYAGGNFMTVGGVMVNHVAKWDGTDWSALGDGTDGPVFTLVVHGGNLFAAGLFVTAGGDTVNNIAVWNGISWSAIGHGLGAGGIEAVNAIAFVGDSLFAAGFFLSSGTDSLDCLAQWDGSKWNTVGMDLDWQGGIYSLAAKEDSLYVGGYYHSVSGDTGGYIAKWDRVSWFPLGSGTNDAPRALAIRGDTLYAGGTFLAANGISTIGVMMWDGTHWDSLGPDYQVNALTASGNILYDGLDQWDGISWKSLQNSAGSYNGLSDRANSIAFKGNDVYVGGLFKSAGNVTVNYIAKWDGSTWSDIGGGVGGRVNAIAVSGDSLYAGGVFTVAGGDSASHIAMWDGVHWHSVGGGIDGTVNAIVLKNDTVFAGGNFHTAGGMQTRNIAMWDGSNWTALGTGVNASVSAIAITNSGLLVGGSFSTAGGTAVNHIAQWDGSTWSELGDGLVSTVRSIAVQGNLIYAGGGGIFEWDGNTWTTIGTGSGRAISKSGNAVYADNNGIQRWDGKGWTDLGNGVNSSVVAIAARGDEIFMGGGFTIVDGRASSHFAHLAKALYSITFNVGRQWNLVSLPMKVNDNSRTSNFPGAISRTFAYQKRYVETDTLRHGSGYWIKYGSAQNLAITGSLLENDTVTVIKGWNLLGSLSSSIAVNTISSPDSGITVSPVYAYDSTGYAIVDSLHPGHGYWIKTSRNGSLVLSTPALIMPVAHRAPIIPGNETPPPPPRGSSEQLVPPTFALEQNYPNPFNPVTTIRYSLPADAYVKLYVYNILGQEVAVLVDGIQNAGYKSAQLAVSELPSGIYFYRFTSGTFTQVRKMVVMR